MDAIQRSDVVKDSMAAAIFAVLVAIYIQIAQIAAALQVLAGTTK